MSDPRSSHQKDWLGVMAPRFDADSVWRYECQKCGAWTLVVGQPGEIIPQKPSRWSRANICDRCQAPAWMRKATMAQKIREQVFYNTVVTNRVGFVPGEIQPPKPPRKKRAA